MRKIGVSIAGFDPSAGAGILLDTAVFRKEGIFPMGVITSVLPQNSAGVKDYLPLNEQQIKKSFEEIEKDFEISGIKIGVIGKFGIVKIIYNFIKNKSVPIIIDPILVSGTGYKLYNNKIIEFYKSELFPKATLITPNLVELEIISGEKLNTEEKAVKAGLKLSKQIKTDVLLKGGHIKGNDFLFTGGEIKKIEGSLVDKDVHGTGCLLSSLILSKMIKNPQTDVYKIIYESKKELTNYIKNSIKLGKGIKYYLEV